VIHVGGATFGAPNVFYPAFQTISHPLICSVGRAGHPTMIHESAVKQTNTINTKYNKYKDTHSKFKNTKTPTQNLPNAIHYGSIRKTDIKER
jgi:hypothetical protein